MRIECYGQSAFRLTDGAATVFIDPFADMTPLRGRGRRWDYPPIGDVRADLLLVTHEHLDHNGVEAVGGDPTTLRTTAGRLDSPVGEVVAVASEHDEAAGTERGPNTLFAFMLGAITIAGELGARIIVPMHYRTARIDFLEPVDEFLAGAARAERLTSPAFELETLPTGDGPLVVVPAAP